MAMRGMRRKACWNCGAEVELDIMICPHCTSDLSSAAVSIAPPPRRDSPEFSTVPEPLYRPNRADPSISHHGYGLGGFTEGEGSRAEHAVPQDTRGFLTTFLLCLIGSVLLLFGSALLFLSDGEVLTLTWRANLWPLFYLLSLPLLVMGWRSWRTLDTEDTPE